MALFEVGVRLSRVRVNQDALLAPGSSVYIAAERAGRAAVDHVHDSMRQHDVIDSGELYNSVKYYVYRSGRGISISVGTDAPHAKYVEFGTRTPIPGAGPKWMPVQIKRGPFLVLSRVKGQAPKPYLRDSLKKVAPRDWSR